MANSIPNNPGFKAGGTAGNIDLLLDLFSGEVQASYERMTVMRDKHRVIKLENGKSVRFPRVGRAEAKYHTPGTEILGDQIGHDEIVLSLDDKLVSSVFVADIHEIMNHFDVRAEYTRLLAEAIAVQYDQNVMRAVIKAARTNDLLGGPVAAPIQVAGLDTDVTKLFKAISDAKMQLDLNGVRVDSEPVYALLKTAQWYLLAQSDRNLNRDYNGGDATIRNHTLNTIDGVNIIKSNICPWADDRANASIPARYRIATNTTVGAVWTKDAVGTAEAQSMSVQTEEQISKQGTLLLARQMTGTDTLRSSNAVELRTGAPATT